MKTCPSCGADARAEQRFCGSCGQVLDSSSQVSTTTGLGVAVVPPRVGRLKSSDTIPVGGFTPGTILADRYRIIGLLGRGGMGEVYRADDLKLGQPVALKFLPRALADDPVRRERFFAEVRITRQLSHPNICRVYDIAEVDGQHFLSMEFIDGEDLASLLQRIGHLPNEKALDIARQLLAGLGAAHERGVLHRDLKPANIMLDGRGRVRVTDFGLAIAASDESQAGDTSGTPAYMAPEQLAGKGATVRSDIYAFGLVLYEIYTGARAFTAATLPELRAQKEQHTPTAPSEIRTGIDPVVERIIVRCLERDSQARPASVAQLAAALPGGDPLAAALAAGETPSPELVAASGSREGLRPLVALALLAGIVLGSVFAVSLHTRASIVGRVPPGKAPAVLAERAREIIKKAGHAEPAADSAFGFELDQALVRYIVDTDTSLNRWTRLTAYSPLLFWYRQSPRPLEHNLLPFLGDIVTPAVSRTDPPLQVPGDALVLLDAEGHLRGFQAVPPQPGDEVTTPVPLVNWTALLADAGFDASQWTPSEPRSDPPYYADELKAWRGSVPGHTDAPFRIEASSVRGRLVSFSIVGPWTPFAQSGLPPRARVAGLVLILSFLACAVFFARLNLRLGRGDRRGAIRLAGVVIASIAVSWLLGEHHVATVWEVALFVNFAGSALFFGGVVWVFYLALEPFVRRRWPKVMVSWTRLLSGDWRDVLIGRDVLLGCAAGVALASLWLLLPVSPTWVGRPEWNLDLSVPPSGTVTFLGSVLLHFRFSAVTLSLLLLFVLFFLRVLLRNTWIAGVVWMWIVSAPYSQGSVRGGWVEVLLSVAVTLLMLAVLLRFGLLTFCVALFVGILLRNSSMTFDSSVWYSGVTYGVFVIVAAISLYGFRASLGGRRVIDWQGIDA
jgi:hypothetical protein